MENWRTRLADLLVDSRHNYTLREQLEKFIEQEKQKSYEEGYIQGRKEGIDDMIKWAKKRDGLINGLVKVKN